MNFIQRVTVSVVLMVSVSAFATSLAGTRIRGKDAEDFIAKYFPNAVTPGPVEGFFNTKDEHGNAIKAYAHCNYPAMGQRSDGAETECTLKTNLVYLTGAKAESFIARHFATASIPGPAEGDFTYINRLNLKATGYAECEYPAMGVRSEGEVTRCTVVY